MHLIFRNVNDAFKCLVEIFAGKRKHIYNAPIVKKPSRAGEVLMIEEPVIITYRKPLERVLFNEARDANPFFHLYESLWMLAGRKDVAPLQYYNSAIADIASDDGKTFNGAYGARWRNHLGWQIDQLNEIVYELSTNPNSRRVVLQMWNVLEDLLKIRETKDVCCNVCAFFSLRELPFDDSDPQALAEVSGVDPRRVLDMTVINRSNDLVWGALGANVVHFSFLQEYLANRLGVGVGVYNQMTNNLHVYTERFKPDEWLAGHPQHNSYDTEPARIPLVSDPQRFEQELWKVVEFGFGNEANEKYMFTEPFFEKVAAPMFAAFQSHKARYYKIAQSFIERVEQDDWKSAGYDWLYNRQVAWENKHGVPAGTIQS